eukprot:755206-Hanusia_phi.AAC.4
MVSWERRPAPHWLCSSRCHRRLLLLLLLLLLPNDSVCTDKASYTPLDAPGEAGKKVKIFLVTYATTVRNKAFCLLAASAQLRGFRVNVIGTKRKDSFDKMSYLDKIYALKDFVDSVPFEEGNIIVFVDAYDVLFNRTIKYLLKTFLAMKHRIVYSAEIGCSAGRETLSKRQVACDRGWPYPGVYTITPNLNSGVSIAYQRQFRIFLESCIAEHQAWMAYIKTMPGLVDPYFIGGDQSLISHVVAHGEVRQPNNFASCSRPPYEEYQAPKILPRDASNAARELNITLDYHNKLFLSAYSFRIGKEIIFDNGRVMFDASAFTGCNALHHTWFQSGCYEYVKSRPPKVTPAILHFNGRGIDKEKMFEVAKYMRWPNNSMVQTYQIRDVDNGVSLNLYDECSAFKGSLFCGESMNECLAKES